jgi:DnaK suppressor protein
MTATELRGFHDALVNKAAELEGLMRNRRGIAIEASPELLEQIQLAAGRDVALGTLQRESRQLRDVRDGLDRIALGKFGICVECEASISLKRLAVSPWSSSCVACQESADREWGLRPGVHEGFAGYQLALAAGKGGQP